MSSSSQLDETELPLPAAISQAVGPVAWIATVLQTAREATTQSAPPLAQLTSQSLANQTGVLAALVWHGGGGPLHLSGALAADLRSPPLRDALQRFLERPPTSAVLLPAGERLGCPGRLLVTAQPQGWSIAAILDNDTELSVAALWLRTMQSVAAYLNQPAGLPQSTDAAQSTGAAQQTDATQPTGAQPSGPIVLPPPTAAPHAGQSDQLNQPVLLGYERLHRTLDLRKTCNTIASDGRFLLAADRATVLLKRRRQWITIAVSGVSQINRRSPLLRSLERLVATVAATDTELDYPSADEESIPPQIDEPLQAYLDLAAVDRLQLLPLRVSADLPAGSEPDLPPPAKQVAMLVLESFIAGRDLVAVSEPGGGTTATAAAPNKVASAPPAAAIASPAAASAPRVATRASVQRFVAHAQTAIGNSLEHRRIFALPLWKLLGKLCSAPARWIACAAIGLLLAAAYALFTVQVQHYVTASSTLQPSHQVHLFAPEDGVVRDIHVQHGSQVQAGDPLVTLQSADLERRLAETLAQLQTINRRLAAIRSTRLAGQSSQPSSLDAAIDPLASEEQQLETERDGLETQRGLLTGQLESLQIRSPIAGTVISWDLAQTLDDRPVSRGHRLLTVADLQGPWQLDATIDEADWGAIAEALQRHGDQPAQLPVEFVLSIEPEQTYTANVVRIADAAQPDTLGGSRIAVEIAIKPAEAMPLRPGSQARAKIMTGPRSIAASWFDDLRQAALRSVWFPFQHAQQPKQ